MKAGKHEFVWDGRGDRGEDARMSWTTGRAPDDLRLTCLHFRILLHLGRFNNRKGWCKLSQKDLAEKWQLRRTSINRAVKDLVGWKYIAKKSQEETGDSFCHYRNILDSPSEEGGVSHGDDTPPAQGVSHGENTPRRGGVSPAGNTSVAPEATRVSPLRSPNEVDHVSHIDHRSQPTLFAPDPGDQLIPFSGTDPSEIMRSARAEAARARRGPDTGLPFTPEVLREVQLLGVSTKRLISRYKVKTRHLKIEDPCAYLLEMAREEARKKQGLGANELKRIAAADPAETAEEAAKFRATRAPSKPATDDAPVAAGDALNTALARLGAAVASKKVA